MKHILAIDTSSDLCSVALASDGNFSANQIDAPRQHSQKLLPLIDDLLAKQGLCVGDLDAIAFGRGPGSFTGIRICLGIAQGLAFAHDLPLIPVSTLHALALGALRQGLATAGEWLLVANDARMGEIYWCAYRVETQADGTLFAVALGEEQLNAPEGLCTAPLVASLPEGRGILLGSGATYAALEQLPVRKAYPQAQPLALDMLQLALRPELQHNAVAAEAAEPVYLRDSVAWNKRKRIRSSAAVDSDQGISSQ